jgi:DNA-binding XRE family transcriptional regulator
VAWQLRQARLRAGLTQEQLGHRVGVTKPTVCRLERAERAPSVVIARALIASLRLPDDLAAALLAASVPDAGWSHPSKREHG